jgi:hypothetical protein
VGEQVRDAEGDGFFFRFLAAVPPRAAERTAVQGGRVVAGPHLRECQRHGVKACTVGAKVVQSRVCAAVEARRRVGARSPTAVGMGHVLQVPFASEA